MATSPPRSSTTTTVEITSLGSGPEAADDGRLHPPRAHLGEVRRQGDHKYDGARRRRLGPVRARASRSAASSCASRRTRTTGAASRPSTRSCSGLHQPATRWSPRSRGARSTPRTTCRQAFEQLAEGRRHRRRPGQPGRLRRARDQRRRRPRRSRTRRCTTSKVRQAIAHAIDKQTLVDRVLRRPRHARGRRSARRRTRRGCRRSPRTSSSTFDLDEGEADPRRRRLQGHRTATASARCRAAARRSVPLRRALRVRDRAADRRVHHRLAEGDRHRAPTSEGQRRHAADRRSSARATTTCSCGAGRRSSTRTRCSRTSRATRSRPTPRTRRTTTTTPTGATRSTTSSTSSRSRARPGQAHRDRARDADALLRRRRTTTCSTYDADLQAYRTDRFEGWLSQPAEIGPVIFSNTSPTYANLTPVASTARAAAAADDGGDQRRRRRGHRRRGADRLRRRRRSTAEEREQPAAPASDART